MYQSSSGELKDVTQMETTYITNALNKAYREVWITPIIAEFQVHQRNIIVLSEELNKRIREYDLKQNGGVFL